MSIRFFSSDPWLRIAFSWFGYERAGLSCCFLLCFLVLLLRCLFSRTGVLTNLVVLLYGLISWLARWELAGIESCFAFLTFWDGGDNIALYPRTCGQNGRNGMWNFVIFWFSF